MTPGALTVGFVIDDLGHGGAQKQVALLACALAPRVLARVYVISSVDEPHGNALRACRIPITTIDRRSNVDGTRVVRLARALAADRVDVVHGFLDAANAYAFVAGRTLGKPTILSLRNEKLIMTGARAGALRWMLRHADAVTVNSDAGRAFLVDDLRVDAACVHRVPNIAPTLTPPSTDDPSPPRIGCVGRLVDQKRFDAVLRAFPLVRARLPGARLEIVGDGPNRDDLHALARELQIEDGVEFTGAVDDATARIARMSCLVLSSAFEGLPNAALEAMSLGVPVVACPVGDLASIVLDGSTGVIARDIAPEPLAGAIVRAVTDASLRARARVDGPAFLRERFSEQAALAVLIPLYQRLGKRTGAAAFEATTPVIGE
jgi:glycosyltransferase involved in cell wall biosynthesis